MRRGATMALGIALGVALGAAMDNLAVGVGIGIAFGLVFGAFGGTGVAGDGNGPGDQNAHTMDSGDCNSD